MEIVAVGNSDDCKTSALQVFIAPPVVIPLSPFVVPSAVDLNDDALLGAEDIGDPSADRNLYLIGYVKAVKDSQDGPYSRRRRALAEMPG